MWGVLGLFLSGDSMATQPETPAPQDAPTPARAKGKTHTPFPTRVCRQFMNPAGASPRPLESHLTDDGDRYFMELVDYDGRRFGLAVFPMEERKTKPKRAPATKAAATRRRKKP